MSVSLSNSEYLDIWDVDMMRRPDEINKKRHHTVHYNSENLIVRRGQEFEVKITFNRAYKPTDKIAVEFVIGELSTLKCQWGYFTSCRNIDCVTLKHSVSSHLVRVDSFLS